MAYQIQRVRPEDWSIVRSIRLRALRESPDAFRSTYAEEEQIPDDEWRKRCENGDVGQFLVMDVNGDAVGIVRGAPYQGLEQTAGLFGMWVAPEARRHRLGAALVQAVVEWARSEGYRRLILDVHDSNDSAIRLYDSCGFVPTGETGRLPPPREHMGQHQLVKSLDDQ